jgi:hypothetical protein
MTNTDANGGKQATSNSMGGKYTARILTQWLPALGIASVMLYYSAFLYQHALNVPYADDIYDILLFLTDVSKSQEWTHTAELFFAQHYQHRTLSSRLVYYLAFVLEDEANFRTLIFIGNLALSLLLLMLYLPIRRQPRALLILLPAALVLFQLRLYATSFWSMNAFAFMFVFVYGFASLICLRKLSPVRFMGAILFAFLATFTLASGQVIWLVGLVCIMHQALILRHAHRAAPHAYMAAWLFAAVAVVAVYNVGFENLIPVTHMLYTAWDAPVAVATFFLISLGGALSDGNVGLAVGSGTVLLLAVMWSSMRRWRGQDITLELFAWFVILSLLVMALGRVSFFTWLQHLAGEQGAEIPISDIVLGAAFSARYTFFSLLLLATTVVLLLSQLPRGRSLSIHALVVLMAFAYCVSSYVVYPARVQELLSDLVVKHNKGRYYAIADALKEPRAIVKEAEMLGIYRPVRPLPTPDVIASAPPETPHPHSTLREKAQ